MPPPRQHPALNPAHILTHPTQARKRKFAVQTAKAIAGRSSETAYLTYHSLQYQSYFNCLFGEVPQVKVGKVKYFALVRHTC